MKALSGISIVLLVIISYACSKEDTIRVSIPVDKKFDLNGDLVADVSITYKLYSGNINGSKYEIIKGQLTFENPENELMEYDSVGFLLHNNDTIFMNPDSTQHKWRKGGLVLVTRFHYSDSDWPEYWSIRDESIENTFYLGFRMQMNPESKIIGWMKLGISNITGDIIITEDEYSVEEYMVVVSE
jgi:hypothetical protein